MGIAADTYAKLTREMWDNWYNTIYPKQKELMDKAASGELATEQLARVDQNLQSSQQAARLGLSNSQGRYGVTAEQDQSQDARNALSLAGAKNATREHEKNRSMSILSGAGLGVRQQINVGGM